MLALFVESVLVIFRVNELPMGQKNEQMRRSVSPGLSRLQNVSAANMEKADRLARERVSSFYSHCVLSFNFPMLFIVFFYDTPELQKVIELPPNLKFMSLPSSFQHDLVHQTKTSSHIICLF